MAQQLHLKKEGSHTDTKVSASSNSMLAVKFWPSLSQPPYHPAHHIQTHTLRGPTLNYCICYSLAQILIGMLAQVFQVASINYILHMSLLRPLLEIEIKLFLLVIWLR